MSPLLKCGDGRVAQRCDGSYHSPSFTSPLLCIAGGFDYANDSAPIHTDPESSFEYVVGSTPQAFRSSFARSKDR